MRFVSIVGDSISTYAGYIPGNYAVFYDYDMQQKNGLTSVYDTWWAKVNQSLHAYLCVNNSYSGSKVTGDTFPAAAAAQRTGGLHTEKYTPDLILIYIGFNDFGNGVPIKAKGFRQYFTHDPACFLDAYSKMLSQIKRNYPDAKIVCGTLVRSALACDMDWKFPECYAGVDFEDYNRAIRQACKKQKCYLADLAALEFRYETLDGSHPTRNGHIALHQAWVRCLSEVGLL